MLRMLSPDQLIVDAQPNARNVSSYRHQRLANTNLEREEGWEASEIHLQVTE